MGATAHRFVTPLSVLAAILWSVQAASPRSAAAFPANGPILHAETQTGGSSNSTTVTTSANLTGVSGHLYLAAISTQPKVDVLSISGLGLTWTLVKAQCSGLNTTGVEVWMAQGTPGSNGAVTATLASAPSAAVIAVSRYSGVDAVNPIGNVISGNTNGTNTNALCSDGMPSSSYAFHLATTVNDAVVYSAVAMKGRTHAPGAGYTERAEIRQVGGNLTSSVAVEDKTVAAAGSVTVEGSFSGTADWAEVGLELKPEIPQNGTQYTLSVNTINSGTVALDPPGGIYDAGTVVTLTATPAAGFEFTGWGDGLSGTANPATVTMNTNRKVTANFKVGVPGGGPIVYEGVKIGSSTNSTTVTTSASMAGVAGNLYLAAISTQPKVSVVSISGLGLNWTIVRAKCSGRGTTGIEVWMAHGTPSSSGTITATLANAPAAAVIAVTRYSGVAEVNPVGNAITANTTGTNLNALCSGGADASAYSIDFGTNLNNGVIYSAVAMKGQTHTPGLDFTERCEVRQLNGPNAASVAVQDKKVPSPSAVTVNGSFNGAVDWVAVALVIKPKIPQYTLSVNTINGGHVTLDPPGGVYGAGTVVTLTATPDAGFVFGNWSDALSPAGGTNPATVTMNTNKKVTANFKVSAPGGNPIVYEGTKIGSSVNSATVTTSGSMISAAGNLYLAAISTQPKNTVVSVSGLGLSWSLVSAQCSGRNTTGIEVWMAQGLPQGGSNGTITATLASAASTAVIAVTRYSGVAEVNPVGSVMTANTTGTNTNALCSGGTDNSAYSFDLTTNVDNTVVYGAVAMNGETHAPGPDFRERCEVRQFNGANISSVAVEDKVVVSAAPLGGVTVNGSFNGMTDWAAVALEIKPKPKYELTVNTIGAGSVTLDPPGGVYDAGTVVTLTATPGTGFVFGSWSGDLTGSTNPATITMDGNKNVMVTFESNAPNDQIVHQETQTGGSSGSTTVVTAASLAAANGHLYLAAISTRPRVQVTSVSGLGLSWNLVKAQCSGRETTGIEVWMAQGTPSSNAPVSATLASAPSNAVIAVSRYSGVKSVNPVGNVVSGNTNGINGLCADGADTNLYALNLTTTTSGSVVYGAVALRSRTHTPGAGYTERADFMQGALGAAAAVAVEDKTSQDGASTVTVDGAFSGDVDWAVVALEIKPPLKLTVNILGSGNVTLDPPGGVYDAGTVVTLIPQSGAGFQFGGWSGDLSGSANPATITMNAPKNVTATFTPISSGNQVVLEEVRTGTSTESVTVTTSANLLGVGGHLYLAAISTKARLHIDSVTGLGLTWSLVKKQCAGRGSTMVEVWMALGTPSSNGPVTAHFPAAPSNAVITVLRYSGAYAADPIGNVVSQSTNGEDGLCTGGADTGSYSFTLTTTTNDAVVYAAVALRSKTHTPGAGYTERAEISEGTPNAAAGIAVMDKTVASVSTVTVEGLLSDATDWSVVAVEIKPQASAAKRGNEMAANEILTPPADFQLGQNYPNPFSRGARSPAWGGGNPGTQIDFALPAGGKVILNIYNETGQLVRTLIEGDMAAGRHVVRWNGQNQLGNAVAAGIYLYRLVVHGETGDVVFAQTRRMALLK